MNLKYRNILKLKKEKNNTIIFDSFIDVVFEQIRFKIFNDV